MPALSSFFRTADKPAPPLPNPETGGKHWFHGTSHEFWENDDDDYHQGEDPEVHKDPGGKLRPPDTYEPEHGMFVDKHWNTGLGTHFSSEHETAHQFANFGLHQTSRVAHCRLHMANPKDYDSEFDMSREATKYAHSRGLHYLDRRKRKGKNADQWEDHLDSGGHYGDIPHHEHLGYVDAQTSAQDRRSLDSIDRGDEDQPHEKYDDYLRYHPDREDIVEGFKRHLQDQGHDGITYGNEFEGSKGHKCAIAFEPEHIHMDRWQWLHREKQHLNKEPHDNPRDEQPERLIDRSYTPSEGHHWVGPDKKKLAAAEYQPLNHDELHEHLKSVFHPQVLEARQEKHPKSGWPVSVGEERRLDHIADDVPDWKGDTHALEHWSAPARLKVVDHGPDAANRHNWGMNPNFVAHEPLQHVYRGVSMEEYHQAQERGHLQSDLRGVITSHEGTNAGVDPRTAISYLPPGQHGMVLKIKAKPEHDWRMIRADNYVRTSKPIPMSDVEHAEPYSKSKRWQVYAGHVPDHVLDDERRREAARATYPCPECGHDEATPIRGQMRKGVEVPTGLVSCDRCEHAFNPYVDHQTQRELGEMEQADRKRTHEVFKKVLPEHQFYEQRPSIDDALRQTRESEDARMLPIGLPAVGPLEQPWLKRRREKAVGDSGEFTPEPPGIHSQNARTAKQDSQPTLLANPYHDHNEWFHGTIGEHDDLDPAAVHEGHKPPGNGSGGPQMNKLLGVHFSPLHEVAHGFAGPHHGSAHGRLFHAELHMKNPIHFDSEDSLLRHVWDTTMRSGHFHDDKHDGNQQWNYGSGGTREGINRRLDAARGAPPGSLKARGPHSSIESYLQFHPRQKEIASAYVNHLRYEGHDGITYGNHVEGPHLHHCAIAFDPKTIHVTHVDRMHPTGPPHSAWPEETKQQAQPRVGEVAHHHIRRIHGEPQAFLDEVERYHHGGKLRSEPGSSYFAPNTGRGDYKFHIALHPGYEREHEWLPTGKVFAPSRGGLDPILFDERRTMYPGVHKVIFERLNTILEPMGLFDWQRWSRVYLAGSEASEWWGNRDFDTLIGVEYDEFRKAHPEHADATDDAISDLMNRAFRKDYNDEDWTAPWDGEVWHLTAYVNPDSWDIRRIKPYAAYNMTADTWAVEPVVVGKDWGPEKWPEGTWDMLESYLALIKAIEKLPHPEQERQGANLYDWLHGDRRRAFSDHGTGWSDPGNVLWKALDLHPSEPLTKLVTWKHEEAKDKGETEVSRPWYQGVSA